LQALEQCSLTDVGVVDILAQICEMGAESQLAAFKMDFTSKVIAAVEENPYVLKALAVMCAQCEPARELVVMRLKDMNLTCLITSEHTLPLLTSLTRGSKILKQILCEESVIMNYLKSKITDEPCIKVIANISLDHKVFMDQLPLLMQLCS
jgi:hypothetical protein